MAHGLPVRVVVPVGAGRWPAAAGVAFKKKKDLREAFLTVEATDGVIFVPVKPKLATPARQFAARLNDLALRAGGSDAS
ncbi:MAG: hypothetical protein ACJ72N_17470 [Labedaea sp.]